MKKNLDPKYPIYVISKGRFKNCLTAKFLVEDNVPFNLVVEPQESEEYIKRFGKENVLILPFKNLGLRSIPARNWVKEHATATPHGAHGRHWILDDNIRKIYRRYKGRRIRCNANNAFSIVEEFIDRFENVAIAGLNYAMFVGIQGGKTGLPPFYLNVRVYSCFLILNEISQKWRGRYNEDTDLCLQVLSAGWCTVLINAFAIEKMQTMTMRGGNSDELYRGDGRIHMARSLQRMWPGVVETKRRYQRPQHVVKFSWRRFDTPLKKKPNIKNKKKSEYGMILNQMKSKIKSKSVKDLMEQYNEIEI